MDNSLSNFFKLLYKDKKPHESIELKYLEKDKITTKLFKDVNYVIGVLTAKQDYVKTLNMWFDVNIKDDVSLNIYNTCVCINVPNDQIEIKLSEYYKANMQPSAVMSTGESYQVYWFIERGMCPPPELPTDNRVEYPLLPLSWNNELDKPQQVTILQLTERRYGVEQQKTGEFVPDKPDVPENKIAVVPEVIHETDVEVKEINAEEEKLKEQQAEMISKFADFSNVEKIHRKWFYIEDPDYLKVIHSVVISHYFNSKPLWLLCVAPPSGMKTSAIFPLAGTKDVFDVSSLTSKTLVSGDKPIPDSDIQPSMLHNLSRYNKTDCTHTHGLLLFKDFTTILQLRPDERADILQQLREIYDGSYTKPFGKSRVVRWKGKVTFLAGVTEWYEQWRQIDQTLGERYLLYKNVIVDRFAMAMKSSLQVGKEDVMNQEINDVVRDFHSKRYIPNIDLITISHKMTEKCAYLSDIVTDGRSSPTRDYQHNITYVSKSELPTRLMNQLMVMMKALAIINRRSEVTEEEYRITKKLAIMTIANDRWQVIQHLWSIGGANANISEVSEATGIPYMACYRTIETLQCFKIVTAMMKDNKYAASSVKLSDDFYNRCVKAEISMPRQEMQNNEATNE